MKLTIITSALLVAGLALAQTPAVQTTTTAQPAQQQVVAKAKKTKKNKKGKKVEEKTTQAAPAAQTAPVAKAEAASVQVERNVASKEVSASVKDASVTPAQTSTTTAATAAAPTKKWGVSIGDVAEFSSQVDGESAIRDIGNSQVKNSFYLGASYKVTEKSAVGVRQYFNHTHTPGQDSSVDGIKQDWTALTFSTSTKGILGSDDIAPFFRYYLPNDVVEKATYKKDLENFYGILRLDAVVAWTLNPKWTVSYVFSPRQSLGAKQDTNLEEAKDENGNPMTNEMGQKLYKQYYFAPTTKLVHYGAVAYNVNDNIQPYFTAGMTHAVETGIVKSQLDNADLALGAYFMFFGGKLLINPEIGNTVELKKEGKTAAAPRWLQSQDISYSLTSVISL